MTVSRVARPEPKGLERVLRDTLCARFAGGGAVVPSDLPGEFESVFRLIFETAQWHTHTRERAALACLAADTLTRVFMEQLHSLDSEMQHLPERKELVAAQRIVEALHEGATTGVVLELLARAEQFHPAGADEWRELKNAVALRSGANGVGVGFELRALAKRVVERWTALEERCTRIAAERALRHAAVTTMNTLNAALPELAAVTRRLFALLQLEVLEWDLLDHTWDHIDWPTLERAAAAAAAYPNFDSIAARIASGGAAEEHALPELGAEVLLCVDTSGSMIGRAESTAKAFIVHALRRSIRRRRSVWITGYYNGPRTVCAQAKRVIAPDASIVAGMHANALHELTQLLACDGHTGAGFSAALDLALNAIEQHEFRRADVVAVGDFRFPRVTNAHMERIRRVQRDHGIRFHAFTIHPAPLEDPFNVFDFHWRHFVAESPVPGIGSSVGTSAGT